MAKESIEKQRQQVFSQCRRLLRKINDTDQAVLEAPVCQCCDEHCPPEDLTQIDSGQMLCPACLYDLNRIQDTESAQ